MERPSLDKTDEVVEPEMKKSDFTEKMKNVDMQAALTLLGEYIKTGKFPDAPPLPEARCIGIPPPDDNP